MTAVRQRIAVGAVLLMLLVYHGLTIQRQSLFIDEWSELHIARLPIAELAMKPDSMPPLYSLLLRGWVALGSDASARWLSVVCHALSVVAVWQFARRLVSPQVGVASAAVLAALPLPLFYAQFVRGYALMGLLAVLSCGCFAVASRGEKKYWPWFVATSVVGIFSHYYFVILLASLVLVWLLSVGGRPSRAGLLSLAAIGVLASPVLIFLQSDFAYQKHLRDARSMNLPALGYTYASFFSGYTLGPAKVELQTISTTEAAKEMAPWLAAMALCVGPLAWVGFMRLHENRLAGPLVAMAVVPVLLTGGLGAALGVTYNVRFVAWCAAPLAVLLGAGVAESAARRGWLIAPAVGLTLLCTTALFNRHCTPRYFNEDLRTAAQILDQHAGNNAVVFCVSDYLALPLRYYLAEELTVVELPSPGETNVIVRSAADVERAVAACQQFADREMWLIESRAFHGDPEGKLVQRLQAEYGFEEVRQVPGVKLLRATNQGTAHIHVILHPKRIPKARDWPSYGPLNVGPVLGHWFRRKSLRLAPACCSPKNERFWDLLRSVGRPLRRFERTVAKPRQTMNSEGVRDFAC